MELSAVTGRLGIGMGTDAWHTGHLPVLPALDSLAVKRCPLGQTISIVMATPPPLLFYYLTRPV